MAVLLAAGLLAAPASAGRWKLQYFYDQEDSTFAIADLKFPSARRGVAVGVIQYKRNAKPMSLVTTDGGAHWTLAPVEEPPVSLFFLDERQGWMVTTKGIWHTEEAGRNWRKLKSPAGLLRVYFADDSRGWAVGLKKQIFQTSDGGARWERLAVTDEIHTKPEFTQFSAIDFATPQIGLIAGWNKPPRRTDQNLPDWVDPESAVRRRAWPGTTILLETVDGGKTWKPSTASLFGQITQVRLSPRGWGLGLIQYLDAFEYPSEVVRLNWTTGDNRRAFRAKDRLVTDVAISGARAYLGAVERIGKLPVTPFPTRVIMLTSEDTEKWVEMDVDWKATAQRVILAHGGGGMWAATDTGMILKLEP